jgi:hypothetical protein
MWPLRGTHETLFVNFVLFCGYSFSVRILATKEHKDHKEPSDLEWRWFMDKCFGSKNARRAYSGWRGQRGWGEMGTSPVFRPVLGQKV